ncbi:MAG: lipopolysaccharide biosynthesis protein [Crocinitomicaceae bacterium]
MLEKSNPKIQKVSSGIIESAIYKAITIGANLLLVRACVAYMGEEKYGIWIALLSFFTWFSVLEVGISNSFRNELTKRVKLQENSEGKLIISRIFKITSIVYLLVSACLIIVSQLLPIESFFLHENYPKNDFIFAFRVSTVLYMMFFIVFSLNTILLAIHLTKQSYLIAAIQSVSLLIGIYFFQYFKISPSFVIVFTWFTSVPLLVWLVSNLVIFKSKLRNLAPSINKVFSKTTAPFGKIKYGFFVIQLCVLLIYSTDNLIIIKTLNGSEVLRYNVAFKYFNILTVIFNLILTPYWSSFTEAANLKDKTWIRSHIKKLVFIWISIFLGAVFLLIFTDFAYKLWIGKDLHIPISLSIFMGLSILMTAWNSIFAYFLNAISVVKRQTILLIFSASLNLPISFYLIDIYGSAGVIMATCIALLPLSVALPFQYLSEIKKMK